MNHPLPPSLATIVKAEAEKFASGPEGSHDKSWTYEMLSAGFIKGAQFLFAHLAEPGEACGPRGWVYLPAFGMKYPGSYRTAPLRIDERPDFKPQHPEDAQYVPLTELLQARAAGATALEANRLNHEILRSSMAESWSAELEAAKAALASSEACVRVLTEALEKISSSTCKKKTQTHTLNIDRANDALFELGATARQALLDVQR